MSSANSSISPRIRESRVVKALGFMFVGSKPVTHAKTSRTLVLVKFYNLMLTRWRSVDKLNFSSRLGEYQPIRNCENLPESTIRFICFLNASFREIDNAIFFSHDNVEPGHILSQCLHH